MSKPPSELFHGTKGEISFRGDAESVIASRVVGLDLREHPLKQKQLSSKKKKELRAKIKTRTATREEYKRLSWNKRFDKRRDQGVAKFYAEERQRLSHGERGTRNWTSEQREAILKGKKPKFKGATLEAHHTYSASKYPHLANSGAVIYPATHHEHHMGWHGGKYKDSLPGRRIRPINEF